VRRLAHEAQQAVEDGADAPHGVPALCAPMHAGSVTHPRAATCLVQALSMLHEARCALQAC
jgi:hypothetical protein